MSWDLKGCRAKIDRAREHFDALDGEIKAFINSGAYGVWGELDEQTGWKVIAFEINESEPLRWSVLVGDFSYNFRSSLDHLVYQLSGGAERTAFPIFLSSDDYREPKGKRRTVARDVYLRGVPDAERAIIDQYQPYHRVGDKGRDPLAQLAWLNNTDKHRILHTSITQLGDSEFTAKAEDVTGGMEQAELEMLIKPGDVLKNDTPLYRVRTDPPDLKVRVESQMPLRIAFGEGDQFLSTGDLRFIADYVEEVIDRF